MAFQPTRFVHPSSYLEASCALTARFHPYPKAVIFCDTICISTEVETPSVRWRGTLRCPDFPFPTQNKER